MRLAFNLLLTVLVTVAGPARPDTMKTHDPGTHPTELATVGGGCFWCLEALFETLPGVKAVTNGYAGGHLANPTYKQVCGGDTGHAEVVQIEFDPAVISFERILEVFWVAHDPTTLNRQGADVGSQYRSVIMYHSPQQLALAERSKAVANGAMGGKVVTEIVPLPKFYQAEDYHQDYYRKHPEQGYCRIVIKPKLDKLKNH